MLTPIPTPTATPAPEALWLGVDPAVAGVWVALAGVVVSAVIALFAVLISRQATKISENATEIAEKSGEEARNIDRRHERREFYETGLEWLRAEKADLLAHGVAHYPHGLSQLGQVIDSTTAPKLTTWLYEGARVVAAEGTSGSPERKAAYGSLLQQFGDNCALWVKDAENNWKWTRTPFATPGPPTTP